jgi:hypothetical protein
MQLERSSPDVWFDLLTVSLLQDEPRFGLARESDVEPASADFDAHNNIYVMQILNETCETSIPSSYPASVTASKRKRLSARSCSSSVSALRELDPLQVLSHAYQTTSLNHIPHKTKQNVRNNHRRRLDESPRRQQALHQDHPPRHLDSH